MAKKDRYVVALDVGSTKTCALIGEMEEEGGAKVAGAGGGWEGEVGGLGGASGG